MVTDVQLDRCVATLITGPTVSECVKKRMCCSPFFLRMKVNSLGTQPSSDNVE